MKIIILEGTSTGGKTTLAHLIDQKLQKTSKKSFIIDENQTLIPILNNNDPQTAMDHLINIIKTSASKNVDYLIFDRLHLTPAAITNSSIKTFAEVENLLAQYQPLLISINIDEDKLVARIYEALKHRGPSWAAHVDKYGKKEDVTKHYLGAQRKVIKLFEDSKLPKLAINATNNNYEEIADEIIQKIGE
jgi:thymidylate kinase